MLAETMDPIPVTCPRSLGASLRSLRILFVVPREETSTNTNMIFAKRQQEALHRAGVSSRSFYLSSRTSPLTLLHEATRFRKLMAQFQPDLVHAQYGTMTALFSSILTTVPLVITFRGSDLNPCPSINWFRSLLGRALSQLATLRADQIICVSRGLMDRLCWGKERTTVIPNGVDINSFYPQPQCKARATLGWGLEEKVVIFNAGHNPIVKRLDLALAALDVARNRCGKIRLVVLDGHVAPENIPTLLNAGDCLLVTSDWEGSPNIVKEALACALPIVSVDVGDVRERLTGVTPSRIVKRDVQEIGSALAEILFARQRSNGDEIVKQLASENIAARILSVYDAAVGRARCNSTWC